MSPDRQARRDLAEALATMGGTAGDEIHHDLVGPAVYRIYPTASTVTACMNCRHLGLIPSIPKVPVLHWGCPGCGTRWRLEPPPIVWIEGSRPVIVPGRLS